MLLLHQIGSVRVGEVVRYSVTYTPSLDRILPAPTHLHVKIKNTSAIPLRAAYLHGPYTLYCSTAPSTFDPNKKHETTEQEGEPAYEPQLKAGGTWSSRLTVPDIVRQDAGLGEQKEGQQRKSFTWIIEIASQVLFSTTASVHFELLVGRDEKSVTLGFTGVVSSHGAPGRLEDHQAARNTPPAHVKGVFTRAVSLQVDDIASLWSSPAFPSLDETDIQNGETKRKESKNAARKEEEKERPHKKRKKIHLVIITHGLHSNLGADMLYMKESIDAAAKQARKDARNARVDLKKQQAMKADSLKPDIEKQRSKSTPEAIIGPTTSTDLHQDDTEHEDDEQVLVRGFNGNAVKTERGIQYLGKRLAKYVLSLTYPDQPYLPVKSTISQSISRTFTGSTKPTQQDGLQPTHKNSSIAKDENSDAHNLAYKITSISFIGHSLGGLVQTYAIAYIQKHSPGFFDKIEPINFVALASPFLGLSNENPMYVKFALDFGLVGRTGQDLGLTWRAPTIARHGWGSMVGPFTNGDNKSKESNPGAKPLLRILPTGPAHVALKRFRNRSLYSNVVNDGIVPLRTSCLLFLDWRGLGRVAKARRDNGLVGTMVNWGLNEITGQNASTPRRGLFDDLFADSGDETQRKDDKNKTDNGSMVPQADAGSPLDKETYEAEDPTDPSQKQMIPKTSTAKEDASTNIWSTLTSFFRPQAGSQKEPTHKTPSPRQQKIYRRGQTMNAEGESIASSRTATPDPEQHDEGQSSPSNHRKLLVRGSSLYTNNSGDDNLEAPPRTTVFESAGDLLNPPLPPKEYLTDPAARPRTIFHDRVYQPEDIPPPPMKRQRTFMRSRPSSDDINAVPNQAVSDMSKISSEKGHEDGVMRIEEKIARAYHKDMAWRKVLVRLEPDAHNNIIVRRQFANAYGWPVIKHLCDTHFAYTAAALTKDEDEAPVERAKPRDKTANQDGEEVEDQTQPPEAEDVAKLRKSKSIATDEDVPDVTDRHVETLHLRQKNIQAIKEAETIKTRESRSPSELRESRDQVSDLVSLVSAQGEPSSVGSMHSGSAALHRLQRSDSARWSDRFFEGSDDEEEDETELDVELQKAYDRGQGFMSSRQGPKESSEMEHKPAKMMLEDDAAKLVAEPDSISRRSSEQSPIVGSPDPQLLSLTGVGLGRGETKDTGIAEQVARARGNTEEDQGPSLGNPKRTLD